MPGLYPLSVHPQLDAEASLALRTSHGVESRVTLYLGDGTVIPGVPHSGGTVNYDDGQAVRRTAAVVVSQPSLWSEAMDGPLSAVGPELGVEYGIAVPGRPAPVWVPLFRGPIDDSSRKLPLTDGIAVNASDRTIKIVRDRFPVPFQVPAGVSGVEAIKWMIWRSFPGAAVDTSRCSSTYTLGKAFTVAEKPWDDGIGQFENRMDVVVYADRTGGFVIEDVPQLADAPVWVLNAGPGGALVAMDQKTSSAKIVNAFYAKGKQTDGTPIVMGRAVVDDPTRPDYWGTEEVPGPAGRFPRFYASEMIVTQEQADQVAVDGLARWAGIYYQCNPTGLPHPGLEPGLTIATLLPSGLYQRHLVSVVPIPLDGSAQALGTRTTDLPAEDTGTTVEAS